MAYKKKGKGKGQSDPESNAFTDSGKSLPSSPTESGSTTTFRQQKSRVAVIVAKRKTSAQKDELRVKRAYGSKNMEKRKAKAAKVMKKALAMENLPPNNGRHIGRQLIRWNHSTEQLLLLTIYYECARQGVQVPYDAIARRMFAEKESTGASIIQHLGKLRLANLARGAWVPPLVGKGRKNVPLEEDVRGIVKCKGGDGGKDTRFIQWNEDASMLISQDDIIAKDRVKRGPVYFQVESSRRTSAATSPTPNRRFSRRAALVGDESENEVDPAELDSDAEYQPRVKTKSKAGRKKNSFPSLFPQEPRLVLVLKTKPGFLKMFTHGICGPDEDDYQEGELWEPLQGEYPHVENQQSGHVNMEIEDTDHEGTELRNGCQHPYNGITNLLTNIEQAATEARYADEVREAEEEYDEGYMDMDSNYQSANSQENDMTYNAQDTTFRQYDQNLMDAVWAPSPNMNVDYTFGEHDLAVPRANSVPYLQMRFHSQSSAQGELNEPSDGGLTGFAPNQLAQAGYHMRHSGSFIDHESGTGRNIHQQAEGFIGTNDLLLQQPYCPQQQQDSGHLAMQADDRHMFGGLTNQPTASQSTEFQQTTPHDADSTVGFSQEREMANRTYQDTSFGSASGHQQYAQPNRLVSRQAAPTGFRSHEGSSSGLPTYEQTIQPSTFPAEAPPTYKDEWQFGTSDSRVTYGRSFESMFPGPN